LRTDTQHRNDLLELLASETRTARRCRRTPSTSARSFVR